MLISAFQACWSQSGSSLMTLTLTSSRHVERRTCVERVKYGNPFCEQRTGKQGKVAKLRLRCHDTMNILAALGTAVCEAPLLELKRSIPLSEVLPAGHVLRNQLLSAFPLPILRTVDIDFASQDAIDLIIQRILWNMIDQQNDALPAHWAEIFESIRGAATDVSPLGRNARLSLLLHVSASTMFTRLFHIADQSTFGGKLEISPLLESFLTCPQVVAAHRAGSTATGCTKIYPLVPTVLVMSDLNPYLHGYLCFNNCIAVNSADASAATTVIGNSAAVVNLANMIGHLVQQGMQRSISDHSNTHAASKYPKELVAAAPGPVSRKAGERFELALWHGRLLPWWSPSYPEKANTLARQILVALRTTGDLPELTPEFLAQLAGAVGERQPPWCWTPDPGQSDCIMFYDEPHFM
jgi:hypothetical protein